MYNAMRSRKFIKILKNSKTYFLESLQILVLQYHRIDRLDLL